MMRTFAFPMLQFFNYPPAHISSQSSKLSGDVVSQQSPEGIYLELDLQRLSRAFRNGKVVRPITILFFTGENPSGGGTIELQSAVLAPQDLTKSGWISRLLGKLAVKNPIQEMYENMEAQGVTSGEEFITAAEKGANNESLIILGDRRMDITMRKMANALVFDTDPRKLMEAESRITAKLKARIPELTKLDETLRREKRELTQEELSMFVEKLKTKELTMELMTEIKKAAPQLHSALVGERDIFMARGMDVVIVSSSLSAVLPPASLEYVPPHTSIQTLVAVVGLGHISGVGNELKRLGWSPFSPNQC